MLLDTGEVPSKLIPMQRCICLLKMNISAQPLKMALHKNVGVKAGHMVIFLHEKVILLHGSKIKHFFCTVK